MWWWVRERASERAGGRVALLRAEPERERVHAGAMSDLRQSALPAGGTFIPMCRLFRRAGGTALAAGAAINCAASRFV